MQVLSSAQMLSPPEMAALDILAQAVAETRTMEEEKEDLLQDVEVRLLIASLCHSPADSPPQPCHHFPFAAVHLQVPTPAHTALCHPLRSKLL